MDSSYGVINWFVNLDKRFLRQKRKTARIVDIFPSHTEVALKAIIFWPPNTASVLHWCDQGIIMQNFLLSIYLLDALHVLHSAWNSVIPKTIENCFLYGRLSKAANSLVPKEMENENSETEQHLMKSLRNFLYYQSVIQYHRKNLLQ